MENAVQTEEISTEEVVEKSTILDEAEVKEALSIEEGGTEETVLPSDVADFEMPEKFKGKSAEEIAKAYAELEKFKAKKEEPKAKEEETITEGTPDPMIEDGRPEGSADVPEESFNKYLAEVGTNGELSEDSYNELQELGYSKEFVDEKIEYITYKKEKEVAKILEPYGGVDSFKDVSNWARENMTEAQLENINTQLASGNKAIIDAVLSGLYTGYSQGNREAAPESRTLHTNQPQTTKEAGYATKSEYLKDAKDPRYDKDAGYRKQVEQKMLKTDMSKWY